MLEIAARTSLSFSATYNSTLYCNDTNYGSIQIDGDWNGSIQLSGKELDFLADDIYSISSGQGSVNLNSRNKRFLK